MNSKSIDDLHPKFKPMVERFLESLKKNGIDDIVIIETLRDAQTHAANLSKGTSRIKRSLHMDGLAIDIAPRRLIRLTNWAPKDPLWETIGVIGEQHGLVWGGRWKSFVDKPHFQYPNVKLQDGVWIPVSQ